MWLTIVMAVLGGIQQMQQASAREEAAERTRAAAAEAQAISEQNAQREEAETQETLRKQAKQQAVEEAAARAAAAASGFAYNEDDTSPSSIALSLAAQKDENKKQRDYASTAGKSRADVLRRQGGYNYQIGMNQASTLESEADSARFGALGSFFKAGSTLYDGTGSSSLHTPYSGGWGTN